MSQERFRWTHEKVEELVKIRNSVDFAEEFLNNKNNGYKTNKLWQDIANVLGVPVNGKKVAAKYNDLLSVYRKELTESKRTGASPSMWKYWNLFRDSINERVGGDPLVKVEIGCGTPIITEKNEYPSSPTRKIKNVKESKDLKKTAFQAFIDLVEMKKSSMKKEADENEEIKSLKEEIADLKTMMKEYFKKINKFF